MKNKVSPLIIALALSSLPAIGAEKLDGSLKILSLKTGKEITSARVGQDVKLKLSVTDIQLIANKNVTLTYVLSVLPTGSNTPVTLSGKLAALATLPADSGGAAKTKKELNNLSGEQSSVEILTIPDFMPAGKATLTITLSAAGGGAVSVNKTLNIQL
ncbi:MAG: hypothetical protein ABIS50_08550 [Luteolibacter sp.]|uniref:hypothetical protein n=1 Tax=Luteolibacter sp. TaxID=1962973 RepID=UPI003265B86C